MTSLRLALLVVLLSVLSGCTINDPTENEFAPWWINDTSYPATVAYCDGTSTCGSHSWTESLRPGERSRLDNINAGGGNLSVFLVSEGNRQLCIRLARYTKTLRLSTATAAACHAPYS